MFYVAFRSQLSAVAEALERLIINVFFTDERVRLSIQTVESLLPFVDKQKYSSVSHEFEIIEDKYQSLNQKIKHGKKRENYLSYVDESFGNDGTATLPSRFHSRK